MTGSRAWDPPHAQSRRDDFAEAPHLDHAVPVRHGVQRGWRRSGKVQLRVRHVLHDEDAVPGADLHQLLSNCQRHRRTRRVVVVRHRVQQLRPLALRRQPFQGLIHALGEGVILAQFHLDDLAQVPSDPFAASPRNSAARRCTRRPGSGTCRTQRRSRLSRRGSSGSSRTRA